MSNATHETPDENTHFTIGGATIETLEGADGQPLIRFTFKGQTVTGTPEEFGRALVGALQKDEELVIVPVDWLPMHGRDWLRYPDLDLVAVSAALDEAGRGRALAGAAAAA
ncbi:MAG: hypothetical protein JWP40_989 [Blastococcus sp.]|nr:hypothetical protein [Blastococcus sp.]